MVTSFKRNGELIYGNSFKMPGTDVTISDVVLEGGVIVGSEHNPYPNNLNDKEYLNKTFEGAQSLTVILEYKTEGTSNDYIFLYDKNGKRYGKYGGKIQTTRLSRSWEIPCE